MLKTRIIQIFLLLFQKLINILLNFKILLYRYYVYIILFINKIIANKITNNKINIYIIDYSIYIELLYRTAIYFIRDITNNFCFNMITS